MRSLAGEVEVLGAQLARSEAAVQRAAEERTMIERKETDARTERDEAIRTAWTLCEKLESLQDDGTPIDEASRDPWSRIDNAIVKLLGQLDEAFAKARRPEAASARVGTTGFNSRAPTAASPQGTRGEPSQGADGCQPQGTNGGESECESKEGGGRHAAALVGPIRAGSDAGQSRRCCEANTMGLHRDWDTNAAINNAAAFARLGTEIAASAACRATGGSPGDDEPYEPRRGGVAPILVAVAVTTA